MRLSGSRGATILVAILASACGPTASHPSPSPSSVAPTPTHTISGSEARPLRERRPTAPVDLARRIALPELPPQGIAIERHGNVMLLGLDRRPVARLHGFALEYEWTAPGGLIVARRGTYFELRVEAHRLRPLPSRDAAADLAGHARRHIPIDPPRGSLYRDEPVGSWRWADRSPDGATLLAQWSGECEVPTAFFVAAGVTRAVTGEPGLKRAPPSIALGWTADGVAAVLLPEGLCGSGTDHPGVYLFSAPGIGWLFTRIHRDGSARMWGPS